MEVQIFITFLSCFHTLTSEYETSVAELTVDFSCIGKSMEGVLCPDNINSMYCLLFGHETPAIEFSNATEIHCSVILLTPILRHSGLSTRTTQECNEYNLTFIIRRSTAADLLWVLSL